MRHGAYSACENCPCMIKTSVLRALYVFMQKLRACNNSRSIAPVVWDGPLGMAVLTNVYDPRKLSRRKKKDSLPKVRNVVGTGILANKIFSRVWFKIQNFERKNNKCSTMNILLVLILRSLILSLIKT